MAGYCIWPITTQLGAAQAAGTGTRTRTQTQARLFPVSYSSGVPFPTSINGLSLTWDLPLAEAFTSTNIGLLPAPNT